MAGYAQRIYGSRMNEGIMDSTVLVAFFIEAIISIVVISNPLSTSAILLTLTKDLSDAERNAVVWRSIRYSVLILLVFALSGFLIFQIFGFSIGALRIAGGVLLLITAMGMLSPQPSATDAEMAASNISLMPLSIPFTAGPGTIVTVILLMTGAQDVWDTDMGQSLAEMAIVVVAIVIAMGISLYVMLQSPRVYGFLGEGGRQVVTRVMGLIVMAIAIQFIINGALDIVPDFVNAVHDTLG